MIVNEEVITKADDVEFLLRNEGIQGSEISSTSLYIQKNYSLFEQLTKDNLKELTLPTSPVEKKSLKERWTACPSPLPNPPPINAFRASIHTAHEIIKEENNRLRNSISSIEKISESILLLNEKLETLMRLTSAIQFQNMHDPNLTATSIELFLIKTMAILCQSKGTNKL